MTTSPHQSPSRTVAAAPPPASLQIQDSSKTVNVRPVAMLGYCGVANGSVSPAPTTPPVPTPVQYVDGNTRLMYREQ